MAANTRCDRATTFVCLSTSHFTDRFAYRVNHRRRSGDFYRDFTDDLPVQHLRDLHPDSCQNLARIGPAFAVAVLLEQHLKLLNPHGSN